MSPVYKISGPCKSSNIIYKRSSRPIALNNNYVYGNDRPTILAPTKTKRGKVCKIVCTVGEDTKTPDTKVLKFSEKLHKLIAWIKAVCGHEISTVLTSSDIWMLGQCFSTFEDFQAMGDDEPPQYVLRFLHAFESTFYFTYRSGFSALPGPRHYTTDVGWGCMLRSGQMLLAQIVRWFDDARGFNAPFSIHSLTAVADKAVHKRAGDWFGSASICQVLYSALESVSKETTIALHHLRGYVAQDQCVYKDELLSRDTPWRPTVLFIPLRLGIRRLNQMYLPAIKEYFSSPYMIGMVGGTPRHALYFVGYQDDYAFYYDPHPVYTIATGDVHLESYHCYIPTKMPLKKIDPSVAIGFFFATEEEFLDFCTFPST
eukprot:Ihof_evm5s314 gene=Ihof_evmTU5s314